jgi:iron(III) transport system ATP-binding protein
MPNIQLNHVCKNYDRSGHFAVKALDLTIEAGEFMCLLGPSGCGKTTTLRMIAGLEHASGGEIRLGERIVDSVQAGLFIAAEKRNLGLVFQSYALWPHLTVAQNIEFGLKLRKMPRAEREQTLQSVMTTLGIAAYRDRYPSQLSGGQQQRVALARTLAVNPEILLLDEPLSNLDARLRLEMRTELKRIHQQYGTTMLFVTHDQWEAMALATRIAVMKDGELQQVGTPHEIYARPANRFVAEFVGTPPINIIELESRSLFAELLWPYLRSLGDEVAWISAVGIRPERIQLGHLALVSEPRPLQLKARLESVLPTGGSWILELSVAGQRLLLNTQTLPTHREGDVLVLMIAAEDLHLFDSQGRRRELLAADAIPQTHATYPHRYQE